jgi:hypothetical protein
MISILPLNLPKTELNLTRKGSAIYVLCLIRRKRIILTPEEWVRQHFIAFLSNSLGYSKERISVEKGLNYFGLNKRWDIVVYNRNFEPEILIECKAPHIDLNVHVLFQALSYQNALRCKYIGLTNGINHSYWHLDYQKMEFNAIIELPSCNTSNGDYN